LTPFYRNQLIGLAGVLPALLLAGLTLPHADALFSSVAMPADEPGSRLAFAAHWMLLPAVCLLAGVVGAARRGFIAEAIGGTRAPASASLEINLRYNQNTLEQTVLACIAWACLAVMLPRTQLALIPAMATLFAIGRAAFWIGYLIHPMGRAFGMALTAFPTIAAYLMLALRLSGSGAHGGPT
jgi:hypothetical protein